MAIAGLLTGLTTEQKQKRGASIGGSDANVIATGDPEKLLALYRIKIGETEFEDLSGKLPVRVGIQTEPLNLHWFERRYGREITCAGEVRRHEAFPFLTCTLDGMTTTETGKPAVFEAKHTNGARWNPDEFPKRYHAQLHHNMYVCGVDFSYLSVLYDNAGYRVFEVPFDPFYHQSLLRSELEFWECVEARKPPFGISPAPESAAGPPVRELDMTKSNAWTAAAATYRETAAAAKQNGEAKDTMKGMIPADVSRAFGHGLEFKRDARGALRFKEL